MIHECPESLQGMPLYGRPIRGMMHGGHRLAWGGQRRADEENCVPLDRPVARNDYERADRTRDEEMRERMSDLLLASAQGK